MSGAVVVGAGQVSNKDPERIVHPLVLLEEAARLAEDDAGAHVLPHVQSVHAAPMSVFADDDASAMAADRLDLAPGERVQWAYSGAAAQKHLGEVCRRIEDGELEAALLVGGIADASVRHARLAGIDPPAPPTAIWSDGAGRDARSRVSDRHRGQAPTNRASIPEMTSGAAMPPTFFSLVDSALAASAGRDLTGHRRHMAELLAPFSDVAAMNRDLAWNAARRSPDEVAEPTPDNRLVTAHYTKAMCSFPTVDLAAALLVVSTDLADRLAVPTERRVHPWAVSVGREPGPPSVWSDMTRSAVLDALAARVDEVVSRADRTIDAHDLYSCFPAAVELAVDAFGLDAATSGPLTLTGGLPFFGGPGASYVLHSLAETVAHCRRMPDRLTVVVGVGGIVTDFSVGVFGAEPPPAFEHWAAPPVEGRPTASSPNGAATVVASTVAYDRDGSATAVPVIAELADGSRVGARPADGSTEVTTAPAVGSEVTLRTDGDRIHYLRP